MAYTTEITMDQYEGVSAVKASGELDLRVAGEFENALMNAALTDLPVVIDLQPAVYIDTAILAAMARLAIMISKKGHRLKVLVASGSHPEYVLQTVGFDSIMDIEHIAVPAESKA